ncbi:MAG: ankyrin repeat domain-containing protein [Chthonomonadetes bacterium]|nr:ankyrin repeat domain-containing protein [Chthonomonadetes bacterium]
MNVQDAKSGETPLITAVHHCNLQIVQILLSYGADVHRSDLGGLTALHYASANGCHVVIPLLVKQGASVNERDPSGLAPLHLAGNDPACIATLLSLGADPMVKRSPANCPSISQRRLSSLHR